MAKQVSIRKGFVATQQHQGPPNLIPLDSIDIAQLLPGLRDLITRSTRADAVVGSAVQVSASLANYTTISAAVSALPGGGTILVLPGTYVGNVTLSTSNTNLIGMGNASIISGTVTITGSNCSVKFLRCTAGFNLNGNYNMLKEIWMPAAATMFDTGVDNLFEIIKEVT